METVNPVYGTYTIEGTYKSQNPRYYSSEDVINASASFVLSEDVKEDVLISISTDKEIYSVGDIIKVTGRSNDIWVEDLELRSNANWCFIIICNRCRCKISCT